MAKKFTLVLGSLTLLAAVAAAIILFQVRIDPWRLAAVLESLSLVLGVFVALTYAGFVHRLRHWANRSAWAAFGTPLLLLVPYLIFAFGTSTFSIQAAVKLTAYIAIPTLLLLPDRLHRAERAGWRDFAAMLALAAPVGAGWLGGIWVWQYELYFFRPLYTVCIGAYAFMVVRGLEDVGYRLGLRKRDVVDALSNFAALALLAAPLGLALNFIHPHANPLAATELAFHFFDSRFAIPIPDWVNFAVELGATSFFIYLTIAIPEELLFRGILQNFLAKTITRGPRGVYALLVASLVFGAAHLHHPPVPNWKYVILAALAGIFYGNTFRTRQRLSASALTHTLVDTARHFWF